MLNTDTAYNTGKVLRMMNKYNFNINSMMKIALLNPNNNSMIKLLKATSLKPSVMNHLINSKTVDLTRFKKMMFLILCREYQITLYSIK